MFCQTGFDMPLTLSPILSDDKVVKTSHTILPIVNILARWPQDMRMRMQDKKGFALQFVLTYASEETCIDAF